MTAAMMPAVDGKQAFECIGTAHLPASSGTHPEQHCKQHTSKKGLLVKFRRLSCCSVQQCSNPSSPIAAPSSSGCSSSSSGSSRSSSSSKAALAGTKAQPLRVNHHTTAKKGDQGPFASAWQQQQCDDVLIAMQHFDVPGQQQQSPGVQRELSAYFSEEFFDTRSIFSEASLLERQLSDQLHVAAQQALAPAQQLPQTGPWVPEEPLLFAEPGLRFVPVPAVTGFAGFWEVVPERTTPHPQPIDVALGASYIVRKVHKSLPGMDLKEVNNQLLLSAQPKFLPPGLPAAYTEVFEKNSQAGGSWNMRRDMRLGSTVGKIYMTECGMLILRSECKPAFGRKVDIILEDYLTLEEGGTVIVDRMCCLEVATGRRIEQVQVARLRPEKA
ncbi:hypothetical protein OEZ86_000332 [Tetradesmus obliquus]|nr:hypothetical protein OEZ86_000332 [Tetradesmus obliquus]